MHTCLNLYKVNWLFDGKEKTDYGIVEGATFPEAAENLVNDYGEDCLISMDICPLEPGSQTISKDLYKALMKEWDWTKIHVKESN